MESLDSQVMDDLLEFFSSDFGEEDDGNIKAGKSNTDNGDRSNQHSNRRSNRHNNRRYPPFSLLPDFVEEEELEWISNKDAFPMLESVFDLGQNHPTIETSNTSNSNNTMKGNCSSNHLSPISVLDNSSNSANSSGASHRGGSINNGNMALVNFSNNFKVPGKARSKQGRKRRTDMLGHQFLCWPVHEKQPLKKHGSVLSKPSSTIGRKCLHCGAEKTPQWRAGPLGPKTLCNACGVRYKSGRLCDEYRPASSPTFSSELHSNSHRKIVEMKKQKSPIGGSVLKPEMG